MTKNQDQGFFWGVGGWAMVQSKKRGELGVRVKILKSDTICITLSGYMQKRHSHSTHTPLIEIA